MQYGLRLGGIVSPTGLGHAMPHRKHLDRKAALGNQLAKMARLVSTDKKYLVTPCLQTLRQRQAPDDMP